MEEHVEKCPYKQCKVVFEQVMVYGVFAETYKQDPCSFIGYKVYSAQPCRYESTFKSDCPYGSSLNTNMLQTHRLLKEGSYKELRTRII